MRNKPLTGHPQRGFCFELGEKLAASAKKRDMLEANNPASRFSAMNHPARRNMSTSKSYQDYLIESLTDPQEAAAYLETVLEEGNPEAARLALANIAAAVKLRQIRQSNLST